MVGGMFELSPAEVRESERAQRNEQQQNLRGIERAIAPLNNHETRELMVGMRNFSREHPNATVPQMAQEALGHLQRMRDEGTAFGSTPARDNRIMQATRNILEQGVLANLTPGQESINFAAGIRTSGAVQMTPHDAAAIVSNLERQSRNGPLTANQASINIMQSIGGIVSGDSAAYERLAPMAATVGMAFARDETQRAGTSAQGHGTINVLNAVLHNHAPPEVAQYVSREIKLRGLGDQQAVQLAATTLENMQSVMDPNRYQDARANLIGFATSRGIEIPRTRTGGIIIE